MRISDWSSDVCSSDLAEHPQEVGQAEVVDVFVEDIEPGTVTHDPVEAWHLNVDQPTAAIGSSDQVEEAQWIGDVLEHVAQHDGIGRSLCSGAEMTLFDIRGMAFVGVIDATCPTATADRKSTRLNSSH